MAVFVKPGAGAVFVPSDRSTVIARQRLKLLLTFHRHCSGFTFMPPLVRRPAVSPGHLASFVCWCILQQVTPGF